MKLINVQHRPGRHCASTALSNLSNFHGIGWSEALCFGIGCGLGIWYLPNEGKSPARLIHVRSADIEEQFFNRIGQPFRWSTYANAEDSESDLCAVLDNGLPALVQSDIYHLPYYKSTTHFPGHVITVWGYDRERSVFLVTDTERENILEVPFDSMRKARFCKMGFFNIKGNMYAPVRIIMPENLPGILLGAVIDCSSRLMEDNNGFQGIPAMKKWLGELEGWKEFDDWKWTARFTYQVIEKRGTGGGGFRLMYADFLDEAAMTVPRISILGLPAMMRAVAGAWTGLALALKEASECETFEFSRVREMLSRVYSLESEYHTRAMSLARTNVEWPLNR